MNELEARKEELVKARLDKLGAANNEILRLMTTVIQDKQKGATGGAGVLNSFKALFDLKSTSTLGMTSQDRLEFAKLWFQNAQQTREAIAADPGYASVLTSIDQQLNLYQDEISKIDQELKETGSDDKRKKLLEERKERWAMAA